MPDEGHGNEPGDRSVVLGDRQDLARREAVNEVGEACLGFVKSDGVHGHPLSGNHEVSLHFTRQYAAVSTMAESSTP